jgi:hypothetical protein
MAPARDGTGPDFPYYLRPTARGLYKSKLKLETSIPTPMRNDRMYFIIKEALSEMPRSAQQGEKLNSANRRSM